MADADVPIVADDSVDFFPRGGDAGQMRGGLDRGLVDDPRHRRMGALAGRATGAISHRDKTWTQRREPFDRFPEGCLHRLGRRRKKLERDGNIGTDRAACTRKTTRLHFVHANSRVVTGSGSAITRGSRPSQSETVSLLASPRPGTRSSLVIKSSPAAAMKPAISSAAKPSRRCA